MDIPNLSLSFTLLAISAMDILDSLLELPETVFHGYSSLIRSAADAAQDLFESYGYWVIFFGTLFENTLLLGLIIPGALVLIIAGLAAHDGAISVPYAILLGVLGTVIGDTISYCLGRFGWTRFGRAQMFRDFNERVREPILRRGTLFVLVYHFAGYTRVVGPTAAGFLKMPYVKWAPADYGGAALWVCLYMAIGYGLGVLGFSLDSSDSYFRFVEWGLLILVMAWGYYLYRVSARAWERRQQEQEEAEEHQDLVPASRD
jgi:membrane protein DedA with SNARE-associated domain